MSVLIKGMKMPENCWECTGTWLNIGVSVFGGICPFCEKIRTDHDMKTGRHLACPMNALPDNHGRLIDENEVRIVMNWLLTQPQRPTWNDLYHAIQEMNAVIEAEDTS